MRKLIGLVGFKGSGKDTVGKYLHTTYGFQKYSFAGPLKKVVSATFQWSEELLSGETPQSRIWREEPDIWWEQKLDWKNSEWSKFYPRFTPRVALQLIGSDVMRRQINDDLWLLGFEKFYHETSQDIVVTDCRFIHEISRILSLDGSLLRIRRNPDPSWVSEVSSYNNTEWSRFKEEMFQQKIHPSEYEWAKIKINTVIDNMSSVSALLENVDEFMKREHE